MTFFETWDIPCFDKLWNVQKHHEVYTPKGTRWQSLESFWVWQYYWLTWSYRSCPCRCMVKEELTEAEQICTRLQSVGEIGLCYSLMRCLGRCFLQVCSDESLYLPAGKCLPLCIVWICFAFPPKLFTSSRVPKKKKRKCHIVGAQ